jgi:hypothetical protein
MLIPPLLKVCSSSQPALPGCNFLSALGAGVSLYLRPSLVVREVDKHLGILGSTEGVPMMHTHEVAGRLQEEHPCSSHPI